MVHLLFGLLIQEGSVWEPDFSRAIESAKEKRSLVMLKVMEPESEISKKFEREVLGTDLVKQNYSKFVLASAALRVTKTRQYKNLFVPETPMLYALDENREISGFLIGLRSPEIVSIWMTNLESVWRRRESLRFRAKGHLNESDSLQLAFLLASNLKLDEANSRIPTGNFDQDSDLRSLTRLALAQGFQIKKDEPRAIEQFLRLESSTKSDAFRSAAKCELAKLWWSTKPDSAKSRLKQVLALENAPALDKWYADFLLKSQEN